MFFWQPPHLWKAGDDAAGFIFMTSWFRSIPYFGRNTNSHADFFHYVYFFKYTFPENWELYIYLASQFSEEDT